MAAGTVNPDTTAGDVMALVWPCADWSAGPGGTPGAWQRFLDIHLAGMTHADRTVRGAVRPAVE